MINRQKSCKCFLKSSAYNIENQLYFYLGETLAFEKVDFQSSSFISVGTGFNVRSSKFNARVSQFFIIQLHKNGSDFQCLKAQAQ